MIKKEDIKKSNIKKEGKTTLILVGIMAAIIVAVMMIEVDLPTFNNDYSFIKAEVIEVKSETLQEDKLLSNRYIGSQEIKVELLEGDRAGERYSVKNTLSRIYNVHATEGDTIIMRVYEVDGKLKAISVENYKRDQLIWILVGAFIIGLIVLGRFKGLKAALALGFTTFMVIRFLLPMIFLGYSPIMVSILTVSITSILSLLLIGGLNRKTYASVIGTVIGVFIAGTISYIAGGLAHISGISTSEAEELIVIAEQMSIKIDGLMFSAILIASLGAIMDVAVSISSAVFEVHEANPKRGVKDLFNSGMNIGRDVMGTMSNTLILAFLGGSLNIIILLYAYQMSYNQLMNLDLVSIEVIQAIAGSIGIIFTVPIVSLIASLFCKK